jgi:hypothetical protein
MLDGVALGFSVTHTSHVFPYISASAGSSFSPSLIFHLIDFWHHRHGYTYM